MATREKRCTIDITTPSNGRVGKSTITVLDENDKVVDTDLADLRVAKEREKASKRIAERLGKDPATIQKAIDTRWNELIDQRRLLEKQAAAGSAEAVAVEHVELLDSMPLAIRRPLCLVNDRAFAAAWVSMQRTTSRSVDSTGTVRQHDPPLVSAEDVMLIVAGDGRLYADNGPPDARPLAELGLIVRLPSTPPPERGWSGAGVKRFRAGERPDPAEVFERLVSVVDRFIDFSRSLSTQRAMCELTACFILSTYMLDALNVVGYLWPNGEKGTGKTSFLQVIVELAYLGQLILAGSSYACLRDLADYGATLAFDDAEAVMDTKRTDPDKRTLLLAGNRRGATIAVKELEPDGKRWVTRHVNTFCPRLFSAIRLPDDVLGSRSIIVPLVRSGDERRAKSNPLDPKDWPCDRRRLVDDLWALGLANLPDLPAHDRNAADSANLSGRNLDSWRPILAVAHWLQERHGTEGLFDRLEELSVKYQQVERGDFEETDATRILLRALVEMSSGKGPDDAVQIKPREVAECMNKIAKAENLAEEDKAFTTARRVGWLLKRQRFTRPRSRSEDGKVWQATRREIEQTASAYGVVSTTGDAEPASIEPVPF